VDSYSWSEANWEIISNSNIIIDELVSEYKYKDWVSLGKKLPLKAHKSCLNQPMQRKISKVMSNFITENYSIYTFREVIKTEVRIQKPQRGKS
jgi:hypothetical protein